TRVERAVQGVCRGVAVERLHERAAHPHLLRERVALRSLLDLDMLELQTDMRDHLEAGLAAQVCERKLRLRVDRVDLARADRLDLRVLVRAEAEHDRVQLRLRAEPRMRVPRQRKARAAVPPPPPTLPPPHPGHPLLRLPP